MNALERAKAEAEKWVSEYFREAKRVPSFAEYRQLFDIALSHFLKIE